MTETFETALAARADAMADACTRCGKCVEVCPVTGPGGVKAALASEASDQRGNSFAMRAHSASEDARERADDSPPEPGSPARGEPLTRSGTPWRLNVTTSAEPPIAMLSLLPSQSASST